MQQYGDYYQAMNQQYHSVPFWPQPYPYSYWYEQQSAEMQAVSMHPANYSQFYEYGVNRYRREMNESKPAKLSRSQKRRLKKKKLQEELQEQKQAIGDWVRLERKDLIEGLGRIEERERKIKEKKREKLSHLIEIHKEVYKHYCKREGQLEPRNRRVKKDDKKKRLSFIKKMKLAYEKQLGAKAGEKEWESESESEQENTKQQPTQTKLQQSAKQIEYRQIGKLTGVSYQNIRLREWVRNCPNEELEDIALRFINRIAYKQAVNRVKRPQKAKKLIVSGIKECKRTLRTIIDKKRARLLIVALNIERNPLQRGVDDEVQGVLALAGQMQLPVVHISTRARLGRAFTGKFGPRITMVSVINYEGYQDVAQQLLGQWRMACVQYQGL